MKSAWSRCRWWILLMLVPITAAPLARGADEAKQAEQILDRVAFTSARQLWALLQDKTVQRELELLESQQKQLTEFPERLAKARTRLRDALPEEVVAKTAEPRAVLDAAETQVYQVYLRQSQQLSQQMSQAFMDETLLPHQLRRLKQIALQQRLPLLILEKSIAEYLELEQQQLRDVRQLLEAAAADLGELPSTQAARERARKATRDTAAKLNDAQTHRLQLLLGPPAVPAAKEFFQEQKPSP